MEVNNHVSIGLDVGTQSTKIIVYHLESQRIVARSSYQYDLDKQPTSAPTTRAEQHPNKWIQALHVCLKSVASVIEENQYVVVGIGVSGQQHGMVALDKDLHVIRSAKLWCDVEASVEAKEFSANATKALREKLGDDAPIIDIPAGFTAPKALWMKKNEPANWAKMKWIVLPHDYINLCLRTGLGYDMKITDDMETFKSMNVSTEGVIPTTDAGDASGTGLILGEASYVPELAKVVDDCFMESLPIILGPNDSCGTLSPQWKKAVGIDSNDTYSIPLSVGSGDNMMSALGCKCVKAGASCLSLGTSGTIFGVSDAPVQTGTPVAAFHDASGKHLPLVCTMSCTGVLNSVLENWCPGLSHTEATELAALESPGCNGLTFLPYLSGERTPNWPHATGALLGLTPSNMSCMKSPGMIYRAALEGLTYLLADALDQMRESCGEGFNPSSIYVVGGGSKNVFWRQMISDITGLELTFPLESETAALGAAFQAASVFEGKGLDYFVMKQNVEIENVTILPTIDEETIRSYREGYIRYRSLSRKLFS
jgi:xylulokinase